MDFWSITKSLKGVTTALSDTVSDGFDSITGPIGSLSDSLTGKNDTWTLLEHKAYYDEYKHWWLATTKTLLTTAPWVWLATTKNASFQALLTRLIEQPLHDGWNTWTKTHTKQLQHIRKHLKEWTFPVVTDTWLTDKWIMLPKSTHTQALVGFEEFVMNCEQSQRDWDNNAITLELPKKKFSLETNKETIREQAKHINKKSFGVILDHGKLTTLSHQLVKYLKKIESLQELQASAFDGEAKRYDIQIAEVNSSLQKLYTTQWKSALVKIQVWNKLISDSSKIIQTQRQTSIAHSAEYVSLLTSEYTKQEKNTLWMLKSRTKKIKLVDKKSTSSLKKRLAQTKTLDAISKVDEKVIEKSRNTWTSSFTNLHEHTAWISISLWATYLWKMHLIQWLGDYNHANTEHQKSSLKSLEYLGKLVESEYSLIQDLLKKLTRDLKKLQADITSQQSTSLWAPKFVADLIKFIDASESEIIIIKKKRTQMKKQVTSYQQEQKRYSTALKTSVMSTDYTITTLKQSLTLKYLELLWQETTLLENSISQLHDIWSDKKLNLPKTTQHQKIRKMMRLFADGYDKKLNILQETVEWFTLRNSDASSKIKNLEIKKTVLLLKLD